MPPGVRPRSLRAIVVLVAIGGGAVMTWRRSRAVQHVPDAGRAGDLCNRLIDRIEAEPADRRHDASDIVHELKSPLARLRARLAAFERRAGGLPHAAEIAALVEETDQILDLFASLSRLWEIDGGARRDRFVTVDLTAVTRDVVAMLESVAEDAGDRLDATSLLPVQVCGDINLLRQILVNLIENAIRHAPRGTAITVSLVRKSSGVRLVVRDDGPGIPTAEHDTVMRKFGRLDTNAEGQGLGLALVAAIVRLHAGTMRLEDAAPGLRVVIDIPVVP